MKKSIILYTCAGLLLGASYSSAQEPALSATLHSQTPPAQTLVVGTQAVDVARITLTSSGGTVRLRGVLLAADSPSGLGNFTKIEVYDTEDNSLVGTVPNQSENPYLMTFFNSVEVDINKPKTYLVRVRLTDSAAGTVRVGFSGFTFTTASAPSLIGIPIYGNPVTLPGATPIPTPLPTPSLSPTPTPLGFTSLSALGLKEGDTISAAGSNDPDIYIVNDWGYKRLFLNPVIFGFYSHLGGFADVKNVSSETRDVLVTSGLFRNCETNDPKVFGVEITGEDVGVLHWVDTTAAQALQDDPAFFKKVFCINSREFQWYGKGSDYSSVTQVPAYSR